MFKSIFAKYFSVVSMVIVISFIAMGGMQMFFSTRYWVSEKQRMLEENADSLAKITAVIAEQNYFLSGSYSLSGSSILPYMNLMASSIDSFLFIVNNQGDVIINSDNAKGVLNGAQLPHSVQSKLNGSDYMEVGKLDGVYSSRQYTVGVPIWVENGQSCIGYLFGSTSASALSEYLKNNLQVFVLSALGTLTLTFIVLYLMTYRMVRPLRQMASAARSFGMGDFSARIHVQGRDEVAQLASSLNNMAVSLSSVEGMRRSFVANVSHELKTPMTTIAGFIDGILDGTISDDKRNYYLKIVSDEVKRLSRLVKSMLDLSRIDNGELHLNPVQFDLTEQLCSVLITLEQRVDSKNIAVNGLEDSERAEVYADYDLMGQVIYNLVDNAIKFINEGGTLTLHVLHKDNRVYCRIRNTGMGIPAEEMPHIFERFYKSDKSRSLDKNGMGLGLYIVKTVINFHHGEIVVRSVEGEYTEFEFWLPEYESGKRSSAL